MTKHTVNLSWWLLLIFGMWLIIYVVTTLCSYYDIPSETYMVYIIFAVSLVLLKAVCDRPYAIDMDVGASLLSMVMSTTPVPTAPAPLESVEPSAPPYVAKNE